jgi:hypothetical protein
MSRRISAQLRLRLTHAFLSDPLPFGAVARVRWVGQKDGSPPKRRWSAEMPLAVGDTEPATFELPDGGHFSVDIIRPRGNLITREYQVDRGKTRIESIDLGSTSDDNLIWQQISGVVPTSSEIPQRLGGQRRPEQAGRLWSRSYERAYIDCAPNLSHGSPSWSALADLRGDDLRRREGFEAFLPIYSRQVHTRYVSWQFNKPDPDALKNLKDWVRARVSEPSPESRVPRWICVIVGNVVDLVSMPWAWWLKSSDDHPIPDHPIQILRESYSEGTWDENVGRTMLTVRDEKWYPLLEFLASGRLAEAETIVEGVVDQDVLLDALSMKRKGPLVAVAGAIILIARTTSIAPQPWDPWLDNLADWFPHLPDGKILLGCRRLQQARSMADFRTSFEHLHAGFNRGIPFMSATIQMLSLALAQLGCEFEEAEAMRRHVAAVASRVVPDQPFVVMRL